MTVALVIVSDRGDLYLPGCLMDVIQNVDGVLASHLVDDREHKMGMAGAVRSGWEWFLGTGHDYLIHLEEDFRFNGPAPVHAMVDVLERNSQLAQVVLKRQPWSPEEQAAGGIIEMWPESYTQRNGYVEHDRIFSLNPCVIPRRVVELGWPDGNEAQFTERCLDAGFTFGFFGQAADPPRVTHVGQVRGAGWRL